MTAVLCNYYSPAPTNPQCTVSSCRHTRPPLLSGAFVASGGTAPAEQSWTTRKYCTFPHNDDTDLPHQRRKAPPPATSHRRRRVSVFTKSLFWRLFTCLVHNGFSPAWSTATHASVQRRTDHVANQLFSCTPTDFIKIYTDRPASSTRAFDNHDGLNNTRGPGRRPTAPASTTMQPSHVNVVICFLFPLSPLYQHVGHRLCGIHVPCNLCAREASQDAGPYWNVIPLLFSASTSPARFPGNPARTHHE